MKLSMVQTMTALSLVLLLVSTTWAYPSQILGNRLKRSSFSLDAFQITKCSMSEAVNTICYVCGRTYDSMEIYSQCCAGNDANLVAFCEGVFNTR